MKRLFCLILSLIGVVDFLSAQESHYHRALRDQDTDFGLVVEPPASGVGMYWSRVRNADDVMIHKESPEDSIARRNNFKRLCQQAYDAFEAGDDYRTILYGDSALQLRYHTAELYFFMAVSYERYSDYKNAEKHYKKSLKAGYVPAIKPYLAFKQHRKAAKAEKKKKKKGSNL